MADPYRTESACGPPRVYDARSWGMPLNESLSRLAENGEMLEVRCGARFFWLLNIETGASSWRYMDETRPVIGLLVYWGLVRCLLDLSVAKNEAVARFSDGAETRVLGYE